MIPVNFRVSNEWFCNFNDHFSADIYSRVHHMQYLIIYFALIMNNELHYSIQSNVSYSLLYTLLCQLWPLFCRISIISIIVLLSQLCLLTHNGILSVRLWKKCVWTCILEVIQSLKSTVSVHSGRNNFSLLTGKISGSKITLVINIPAISQSLSG